MSEIHNRVLLSVVEAAKYAGVSASLIYKWTTEEKRLPHFRLGGQKKRGAIRIDLADLNAFLETLKVTGVAKAKPALPMGTFNFLPPP